MYDALRHNVGHMEAFHLNLIFSSTWYLGMTGSMFLRSMEVDGFPCAVAGNAV